MSFFINNSNQCKPGPLTGNPMSGICEKVCIETKKVFDACTSQTTETGLVVDLTDFDPAGPTLPLTFISANSTPENPATVENVVVDRLDSKPNFANVSGTVSVPIIVNYRDANNIEGTAQGTIIVPVSVILFVPQPSVTPIAIEAFASFVSQIGTLTESTATLTGCLQIVLKVVAIVDILVPSYGYPVIPPCQAISNNVCPGVFELPLFPTATTIPPRNF